MASIKYGPIVRDVAGSIGGTTFTRTAGGPAAKRRPGQVNPSTAGQANARAIFTTVTKSWQSLTLSQQQAWAAAAPQAPYVNRVNDHRVLNGYNYFVQINSHLAQNGLPTTTTPPPTNAVEEIDLAGIFPTMSGAITTNLAAWWNAGTPSNSAVQIETTPTWSWGGIPDPHQYRSIGTFAPTVTPNQDITAAWIAVFGDLPVATPYKIRARFTPINPTTGVRGCPLEVILAIAAAPPTPPTPARTCLGAPAIAPSLLNDYPTPPGPATWVQLTVTPGVEYSISWTSSSTAGTPTLQSGSSCSSLTTEHTFSDAETYTFVAQDSTSYYLQNAATPPGYTWQALYNPTELPPPPKILSIDPTSGPDTGGTIVDVRGENFTPKQIIYFGLVPAEWWRIETDTTATAKSPPAPAGTVHISVHGPTGCSNQTSFDEFDYVIEPVAGQSSATGRATVVASSVTAPTDHAAAAATARTSSVAIPTEHAQARAAAIASSTSPATGHATGHASAVPGSVSAAAGHAQARGTALASSKAAPAGNAQARAAATNAYILDNFIGTNGATITGRTPNIGAAWTVGIPSSEAGTTSDLKIESNAATNVTSSMTGSFPVAVSIAVSPANNGTASFDFVGTAGFSVGLIGRASSAQNCWLLSAASGGPEIVLYTIVAGTLTSIASSPVTGLTSGVTYTMTLTMNGTSITGKISGSGITTTTVNATSSTFATNTGWGFYNYVDNTFNFKCTMNAFLVTP